MSGNGTNGVKHPAFTEWLRYLEGRLRRANRDKFFGTVSVELSQGHIVRIEVTESIKDPTIKEARPDSVAPDPSSPVG